MKKTYEPPSITELGSLRDLTQSFNKIGGSPDTFTGETQGEVIGSLVPAP